MNPPYGREIGRWMEKAVVESERLATVVCLLPARPGSRWWHDFVTAGESTFLQGRLKFVGASSSALFDSAIVVMRPQLIRLAAG